MGSFVGALALLLASTHPSITLRFDGSLRHPSDPGLPTSSLGRMAACGATIAVPGGPVVRLGGKSFNGPVSSIMTSGEVEYEGLLFALAGLRAYLGDDDDAAGISRSPTVVNELLHISVQGDCKNVIEQMSGMARPRKLEDYHLRAVALIRDTLPRHCRFQFHHIPRAENALCDRISACILLEQQEAALREACTEIESLSLQVHASSHEGHQYKYPSVQNLLERFFSPETSLVPLSRRPEVYRCLSEIAASSNDFTALHAIGKRFEDELESVKASVRRNRQATTTGRGVEAFTVKAFAGQDTLYQLIALENLGRAKETAMLKRNKKYTLERFESEGSLIRERLVAPIRLNGRTMPLQTLEQKSSASTTTTDASTLILRCHDNVQTSNEARAVWVEPRLSCDLDVFTEPILQAFASSLFSSSRP